MSTEHPPPGDLEPTERLEPTAPFTERIGPYCLLQKVGEGGMGEVWLAEQQEPVRRKVALKVIKQGMDTKQVVARFEAERQALALMSHPNIAKVFDAGATEHGRPYFVMEYVKGEPITRYCDRHRLTTKQRLELFAQACDGVQHAHQKGIIHRDIKPSNVLVSVENGRPVPKIIDFGVAKATEHRLTEKTLFTQVGAVVGTPEYMSPEQIEMTSLDVDTRADVYSLGVLLYELLVGVLPFDSRELRHAGFEEARRRIREEEPSKPSTRLNTLGDVSTESAQRRQTDPPTLKRMLRGDLDWITMKALEKDRTRRYGSPTELAADIQRHLTHQPVTAGPPGPAYRLGKFVRRHRVGVGMAAAGLLMLVAFAATMTVQAGRIAAERDRANLEAETALQVSDFLVGLFSISDPGEGRGETVTARELLDVGAQRIGRELATQPLVQARMMDTMGRAYQGLSLLDRAGPLLEEALSTRERELDANDPELATSLSDLGWLRQWQGKFEEARTLHERALAIREQALGPGHLDTAWALYRLALLHAMQGEFEEARSYYHRALPTFEEAGGPDHIGVAWCLNDLAGIYMIGEQDPASALPLYERSLAIKERTLGPEHSDVATTMHNLAVVYEKAGDQKKAVGTMARAVALRERILGPEHGEVAFLLINQALMYLRAGDRAAAEESYERSLSIFDKTWGLDNPQVLFHRACYLAWTGERAEALSYLRRAVAGGFQGNWNMDELAPLHGDPEFEAIIAQAGSGNEGNP